MVSQSLCILAMIAVITNPSFIIIAYPSIIILHTRYDNLSILHQSLKFAITNFGPVHKGTNHVPKAVSERDSDPFLIWKPDFIIGEHKALSNQAFDTKRRAFWIVIRLERLILPFVNAKFFQIRLLKCEKKGVLDRDPPTCRKADFTLGERKALLEHDLCVRILEMRAETMHGSICAVGTTKYYHAVRRSCLWLGWQLQCLWTHVHVVQITKQIAIRNGFGTWFTPCEPVPCVS